MQRLSYYVTQDQRNAIYAFGQVNRLKTAETMRQLSELIPDFCLSVRIHGLADEIEAVTDEQWMQEFYTIRHRKETIMNYMVAIYQDATGDLWTPRPWKTLAMQQMIGTFGSEIPAETIARLKLVEKLTMEPMLKSAMKELIDTLKDVSRHAPETYGNILAVGRDSLQYRCCNDNEVYERIMKEGHYGKIQ